MNRINQLNKILQDKFGQPIYNHLVSNRMTLDFNKIVRKGSGKKEVNDQLESLVRKGLLDESFFEKYKGNWAFDFPGWVGELKEANNRLRDYMIIQAEPHVENYDFQIVYEFAEREYGKDFSIIGNKIKSNSGRDIWSRVIKFIANDNEYEKIFDNKDKAVLYDILEKVYITDICHFAPQIQVKELLKQKAWTKKGGVRDKIAQNFLVKEIKTINPKMIISSGKSSIAAVNEYLLQLPEFEKKEILNTTDIKGRGINDIPVLYELYRENTFFTYLLCVPHLGFDGYSAGTFWKEKGRVLHDEMKNRIKKGWL
jgi:hypothetical protein